MPSAAADDSGAKSHDWLRSFAIIGVVVGAGLLLSERALKRDWPDKGGIIATLKAQIGSLGWRAHQRMPDEEAGESQGVSELPDEASPALRPVEQGEYELRDHNDPAALCSEDNVAPHVAKHLSAPHVAKHLSEEGSSEVDLEVPSAMSLTKQSTGLKWHHDDRSHLDEGSSIWFDSGSIDEQMQAKRQHQSRRRMRARARRGASAINDGEVPDCEDLSGSDSELSAYLPPESAVSVPPHKPNNETAQTTK